MSRGSALACLVACFLAVSVVAYTDYPRVSAEPALDELERAGLAVWRRENCQACHQLYGFGGFLGPDLTNRVTEETAFEEIVEVVLLGRGAMPAFDLTEEELDGLFAWLSWMDMSGRSQPRPLQARRSVAPAAHFAELLEEWTCASGRPPPAAVRVGLELWTTASCGSCHRPFATGARGEPDLSARAVDRSLEALGAILDQGRGRMPVTPLEPDEKRALQSFLGWIAEHRGELVVLDRGLTELEPFDLGDVPWFEYR